MKCTKERSQTICLDNLFRNSIKWKSLELLLKKFTSIKFLYTLKVDFRIKLDFNFFIFINFGIGFKFVNFNINFFIILLVY